MKRLPAIYCLMLVVAMAGSASAASWYPSNPYPLAASGGTCAAYNGAIYCLGGSTSGIPVNQSYYSLLFSGGTAQWQKGESYLLNATGQSCATIASSIYCVGGYNSTSYFNYAYSAQLTRSGAGNWTGLEAYPINIYGSSCFSSGSELYCTGGSSDGVPTSASYYTGVTGGILSGWNLTTPYPLNVTYQSCQAYKGYVFCVGGINESGNFTNETFFAQLSGSGISQWQPSTPYPVGIAEENCVIYQISIYCIGGLRQSGATAAVYHAALSAQGIGAWSPAQPYPVNATGIACANGGNSNIYCVGGFDGSNDTGSAYYLGFSSGGQPQNVTSPVVVSNSTQVGVNSSTQTHTNSTTPAAPPGQSADGTLYIILAIAIVALLIAYLYSRGILRLGSIPGKKPPKP